MPFLEALQKLDIEDYGDRIFSSNSHGELFHIMDYIYIAENNEDPSWFKAWFESMIKMAEENWNRPESVFQHIPSLLQQSVDLANERQQPMNYSTLTVEELKRLADDEDQEALIELGRHVLSDSPLFEDDECEGCTDLAAQLEKLEAVLVEIREAFEDDDKLRLSTLLDDN
jgi:hypothetical protein